MGNHDEFDLDVRFANSGSMWASEHPQQEQEQEAGLSGRFTCVHNPTRAGNTDCGTCEGDTQGCAGCQTQTCNTQCNQNTCANTCGNQNTCGCQPGTDGTCGTCHKPMC